MMTGLQNRCSRLMPRNKTGSTIHEQQERMLSVVFAAVAGSSRLFEKLAGAEALHAVDRCMKRMRRGIDGFHGRIVKTGRDDLTALFDNANDACQAAIAMQRRVADLPPVSGVQLAIRVGFHHGAVIEER
jgi:adenylate cyclase